LWMIALIDSTRCVDCIPAVNIHFVNAHAHECRIEYIGLRR